MQTTVRITVDSENTGVNGSDGGGSRRGGLNSEDLEARPLVKGEDGEYENTRGQDNRQVLQQQKKMLKN